MSHLGEYIEQIHKEQKKSVIEELKKIKTEANIQAYVANIELDDYTARTKRKLVVDLDMVYKIIDNHISELKGE